MKNSLPFVKKGGKSVRTRKWSTVNKLIAGQWENVIFTRWVNVSIVICNEQIQEGETCTLYRQCRICNEVKYYKLFLRITNQGRAKMRRYCYECREIVQQQEKPLDLGIDALDSSSSYVELYGAKRKWKREISYDLAIKYIMEGAARVVSSNCIVKRYDDNQLRQLIFDQYERQCFFCKGQATIICKIIPKSDGGLRTLKNCVCACNSCMNVSLKRRYKGAIKYALPIYDLIGNIYSAIENPNEKQLRNYKDTKQISVFCDYSLHQNQLSGGYGVIAVGCGRIIGTTQSMEQTSPVTHEEELKGILYAINNIDLFLSDLKKLPVKVIFFSDVGNVSRIMKGEICRYLSIANHINQSLERIRNKYRLTRFAIYNISLSKDRSYYGLAHRLARRAIGLQ